MKLLSTATHGCPIAKLRFHQHKRLLASVGGPRADICIWSWDELGALHCITRINQSGNGRVNDIAWHPSGDSLAIATGGRSIEVWSVPEGALMGEYGIRPTAPLKITWMIDVPVEKQGASNVTFCASGDLLVASSQIFRVGSGQLVDTFWSNDTTFALHPEGELIATIASDQLATAVRFGRLTDRFHGYDAQLNVPADGYTRLVFNPKGDAFALMGHAYGIGIRVYEFPSCQILFEMDFEKWQDLWNYLWIEYRGAERYAPNSDGSYPYEFINDLWTTNDRLAFHPNGRLLLIGTMQGLIVGVNLADTSKPSGVWTVHNGPVLALDVSTSHAMLATARCDGEIRLWRIECDPATQLSSDKPMTKAFLEIFQPIDSMAHEDEFCTTDGKKWYDLKTIGAEELDDATPWAQNAQAKWWHQKNWPNS